MVPKNREQDARDAPRPARLDLALKAVGATATVVTAGSSLGALAALPESVRVLRLAWASWQEDRARRFLRDLLGQDLSEEGLAAELSKGLEDRRFQEAVRQAVGAALEASGDHVLPPLARLVGEYRAAGLEPDAFFRGVCRVLQEVSAREYASLAGLVRAVAATELPDEDWLHVGVTAGGGAGERVGVWASGASAAPTTVAASECDPALAPRLLHLLGREWLARAKQEDGSSGTARATVQVATARRIAGILS